MLASLREELSLSKVVEMLLDMRTYRMGLIQTEDQLRFSVDAIVQGGKKAGLVQHLNGKRLAEQGEMKAVLVNGKDWLIMRQGRRMREIIMEVLRRGRTQNLDDCGAVSATLLDGKMFSIRRRNRIYF